MVHPLSEQLDGWLRSLFLHSWHVEVVDEDCHAFVVGGTKMSTLPQHEFLFYLFLSVVS